MTAVFRNLPRITSENGLNRYLQEIRKYPLLEPEYERELAMKWTKKKCIRSAHIMVTSHLRLVAKIAMGYKGYGLPINELISEGNIGMLESIKRFDYKKGFRLATYAMWWIRASIQEYILHTWSLVKMGTTAAQKKLFFNLRKIKSSLRAYEEGDMLPENVKTIAKNLNVSKKEVTEMNRRLSGPDHSLNAPLKEDGEGEWQDWLVDGNPTQEHLISNSQELDQRKNLLAEAINVLSPREKYIMVERRLKDKPKTLEDLSNHYKISRERVRQIEVRAMEKLKKSVKNLLIKKNLEREEISETLN
ncbi:MAG: RNA polymerase sigma factor RpoH [Alphaproteobacteria bacterium MarineAlpha6_Bin5]|nr:MAG: RNA polymerase sigma factor RpoH [Alphaproteobacteria bacterium MarineAlpha6_Bin5]|tara:strand:+ start:135 stop:1046 length:912 start_codon:yes stop_codon:yes gene_type:complete